MIFLRPTVMVWVFWLGSVPIFGQQMNSNSARALAIGNTASVIEDEWGTIQNPGGILFSEYTHNLVMSYHNRYVQYGIHDGHIGYGVSFGKVNAAATVSYFGDNLLNQSKIGLAAAHKIRFARLGVRLNYHQVALRGYQANKAFSIDIGGVFTLSPELVLGMSFVNIGQSKYLGEIENSVPSGMTLGLAYLPIKELRIHLQLDKDLRLSEDVRAGMEYQLNEVFRIGTGLSFLKPVAYGGLGIHFNNITLDLAGQYHFDLGFSGMFSTRIGFAHK